MEKLQKIIEQTEDFNRMLRGIKCPYVRYRYENIMLENMEYAMELLKKLRDAPASPKIFTAEELSNFDGTHGKPAYAAVNGIVYDVSMEPTWGGASHFGLLAGKDLTEQFKSCHGNISVLSGLPVVGKLKQNRSE